jgi:acetylornithine deacetylase/succinyl-diaminopimelate desuccinylase-like protein
MRPPDLDFLEALLRLKTTNEPSNRGEHDRCRELIAREAERHNLRSTIVNSEPCPSILVGPRPDERQPRVLLAAHLDVVPAAPEHYEPRVEGDKLVARGVSDMKFIAPLYFQLFDDLPASLRDRVLTAFTFDEEVGGNAGTRYLLDEYGLRAGTCFLPDGGDNFQLEADEKGVLQFRVRTTGKAAHGSRPWLGENAIDKLLAIYRDLRVEFPVVDRPGLWGPTLNLGRVSGGAAANQVADTAEALLDTRFTEATTLEATLARVREIVAGRGEVEPVVSGDLFHLDVASSSYRWIQEAARVHLGRELPIYRSEGASDARFFTKHGIPVVIAKPVCGGHHSAHEWLDLASLEPYYRMMRQFVEQAATSDETRIRS